MLLVVVAVVIQKTLSGLAWKGFETQVMPSGATSL
jgi:hypothetical protein